MKCYPEAPVTFQERIFKLFELRATDSEEFKTWLAIYGRKKLEAIFELYKENRKTKPIGESIQVDDEWTLVDGAILSLMNPEDILERGTQLPGGAVYARLKSAVQAPQPQLVSY